MDSYGLTSMLSEVSGSEKKKRQKRFYEEVKEKDRNALRSLLKTEYGRWFLMRLLDRCQVFSECFTGNSTTFFNEGMRKVGLLYLSDLKGLGVDGIRLKQKAELEYVKAQFKMQEGIEKEGSAEV